MGWETRNGSRYYYAARKEGDRVVKEYLGRGPAAELAAGLDASARRRRAERVEARRAEEARIEPAVRALKALDGACRLRLETAMNEAGFARRNFGPWRRRRQTGPPRDEGSDTGRGRPSRAAADPPRSTNQGK